MLVCMLSVLIWVINFTLMHQQVPNFGDVLILA